MNEWASKIGQRVQLDSQLWLERLRQISFSSPQLFVLLNIVYILLILLSSLLLVVAGASYFHSTPFDPYQKARVTYSFAQSADERQRLLSCFDRAGTEGHDPLWLDLRGYLELSALNARADAGEGTAVTLRWLTDGSELRGGLGQTLYFAHRSGQWRLVDQEVAQLAIKILDLKLLDQRMQLELELLHPQGGLWQSVELVTLVRPVTKKVAELAPLQALTRHGCRWWGTDLFLLNHSDPDRPILTQRIEVGPVNKAQVLYLAPGEGIIQEGQEFLVSPLGEQTQGKPLWVIEEAKSDRLEIVGWSASGDLAHRISLVKQQEPWQPRSLESQIQVTGVRAKDQLLVQIQQERWNLKVDDWLLHTSKGWVKIRTPEQVDRYVEGKDRGELLILRKIGQDQGHWVASFRAYSPARSHAYDFDLRIGGVAGPSAAVAGTRSAAASSEPLREPSSFFIQLPEEIGEELQWPKELDRACEPASDPSSERILEEIQRLSKASRRAADRSSAEE